jgi:uncharacterized membrane protein SirB2
MLLTLHALFALLSGVSFFVRGIGHLRAQSWVKQKLVRILPHIIDTGLLVTAILLLVSLELSPLTDWVLAKIVALILYVFFGVMAFRIAKTPQKKAFYWIVALGVFMYMMAVAKTHNPFVFL